MNFINPASGPAAVGPYSSGVKLDNGFLYFSGQIPIDPATGKISGSNAAEQARVILQNIGNMLSECGYSLKDIFKVVVYMTDLDQFADFNKVYADFMGAHKPVRTTVQVSRLPLAAQIEIEITAFRSPH